MFEKPRNITRFSVNTGPCCNGVGVGLWKAQIQSPASQLWPLFKKYIVKNVKLNKILKSCDILSAFLPKHTHKNTCTSTACTTLQTPLKTHAIPPSHSHRETHMDAHARELTTFVKGLETNLSCSNSKIVC